MSARKDPTVQDWRAVDFADTVLKPCPFCGFKPDPKDWDCIYPASRERTEDGDFAYWNLHCYSTGGGCGAEIIAGSPEECVDNWNRRVEK